MSRAEAEAAAEWAKTAMDIYLVKPGYPDQKIPANSLETIGSLLERLAPELNVPGSMSQALRLVFAGTILPHDAILEQQGIVEV